MSQELAVAVLDRLVTNMEKPVGDEIINGSLDCSNRDTQANENVDAVLNRLIDVSANSCR